MTVLPCSARRFAIPVFFTSIAACVILLHWYSASAQIVGDSWRGLAVAPEHRCSAYVRQDYRYPQSVEAGIVVSMGGRIYGPYTGRYFASTRRPTSSTSSPSPRRTQRPLRRRPGDPPSASPVTRST